MKFGKYLLGSMREEWRSHFCDYKRLKELIKKITEQKLGAESKFLLTLEAEMNKVHGFYQSTVRELRQRLGNKPSDEDLHDVTLQLLQISQFAFVNETAFRKILKKHDRTSPQAMSHIFALKLVSDDYCPKAPLEEVMLQISALHDAKHARDVPPEKNFSESNFVRKSLKFWVRLPDIAEVICQIIPHLPIYHFKGKEAKSVGSPITSIYFDTPDFYCYKTRMEKHEGAQLIRIRWYGNERPKDGEDVFVERKLHHESWVREASTKTRFKIAEREILPYLTLPAARYRREQEEKKDKGRQLVELEVISEEKKQKEVRKKAEEQALRNEIQQFVQEHKLRPMLRTQYLRAAFQLPHDNTVRISLDTELTMMRERVDFEREWYVPPERLLESDMHRFPFAVLEVKLQEEQDSVRPAWVSELMSSPLLIPAEKFSKFCHGCAILYPNRVPIIPYWLAGELSKHFKEEIHPAPVPHIHLHDNKSTEGLHDTPHESPRGRRSSVDGPLLSLAREGPIRAQSELFAVDSDSGVVRECWRCLSPCLPSGLQPPMPRPVQSRMKIEPKTYFANERTYLQWFNAATLLGSIALALINVGGGSLVVGILFLPVSVCLMCYALWAFQRRLRNIHERLPFGYHDPYGPTILTVVISVALVVSGFFSILAHTKIPK